MKVVAIGIDGLEANILYNFFSSAKHVLRRIFDRSLRFDLFSTTPPMSPPAWSSIITGLNPQRHGIYDFYMYDKVNDKLKIISGKELKNTVFDIMNMEGKKQILINIPFLVAPKEVKGVFVSGLPSTYNSLATFPRYLRDEFERKGLIVGEPPWSLNRSLLTKSIRDRSEFSLDLMSKENWDFTMIVFRETDIVQHFYWGNWPAIYKIYEEIEKSMIKPLIDMATDKKEDMAITIFGDHGFTGGEGVFNITNWLYSKGYYTVSDSIKDKLRVHLMNIIKKIYGYRRVMPLIQTFQEMFLKGGLEYISPGLLSNNVLLSAGGIVDGGGLLYLNPKYQSNKSKITRILRNMVKDTSVIQAVKEINVGDGRKRYSPDFILKLTDGFICNPYYSGDEFIDKKVPPSRLGVHKQKTFLTMTLINKGDLIELKNRKNRPLHVEDVGTIILYLNNLWPPNNLDGRVPPEIFRYMRRYLGLKPSPISRKTSVYMKSRKIMN
jgi:hypothetical protein